MLLALERRPHVLIAVGLLGMTSYALAMRVPSLAARSNDFIQGIWYGACLGVEVLGLILLRRGQSPGRR